MRRRSRATTEPFRSEVRQHLKGRTAELEHLSVEMLARCCSISNVEDAFTSEDWKLLLSKTAVLLLTERLWEDYTEFSARCLSEFDIAYPFVDGVAERLHPDQKREPVLADWGFTSEYKKILLGLMVGSKGDAEMVSSFFQDIRARCLGSPPAGGAGRRTWDHQGDQGMLPPPGGDSTAWSTASAIRR